MPLGAPKVPGLAAMLCLQFHPSGGINIQYSVREKMIDPSNLLDCAHMDMGPVNGRFSLSPTDFQPRAFIKRGQARFLAYMLLVMDSHHGGA